MEGLAPLAIIAFNSKWQFLIGPSGYRLIKRFPPSRQTTVFSEYYYGCERLPEKVSAESHHRDLYASTERWPQVLHHGIVLFGNKGI